MSADARGLVALKEHVYMRMSSVMARDSATAGDTRSHLDTSFNLEDWDLWRMRELLARLVADDVLRDPRARELWRQSLAHASSAPLTGSPAALVLNRAVLPVVPPPRLHGLSQMTAYRELVQHRKLPESSPACQCLSSQAGPLRSPPWGTG